MEVDRRITSPHYDAPFLRWYEGIFESVYIALHPFVKIAGVNPASASQPILYVDRASLPNEPLTMEIVNMLSKQNADNFSFDVPLLQEMEKKVGVSVSWAEIITACEFVSNSQLNKTLLAVIKAIRTEICSAEEVDQLQSYCAANRIFLPTESSFPPILEQKVCDFLKLIGHERILIADEFNSTVIARNRAALETEKSWGSSECINFRIDKIYPEDHSFLLITPFDGFYMAICGSRHTLESARIEKLFEGFWCNDFTRPDWWRQ